MPKPKWSLPHLLAGLHEDIEKRLSTARKAFGHPTTKGDASENVWLELLNTYLPRRYQAAKAHVVDSKGAFSQQIDVLVFDRQYSPFIFSYQGQMIVPALQGGFIENSATINVTVKTPSTNPPFTPAPQDGFTFVADPTTTVTNFAQIGHENNGSLF